MKKRSTWIPVVAAIICRQDEVLLGQRPPQGTLPGVWEFPGGKIELGESPEEALVRELKEELDIDAQVEDIHIATTHTYNEVGILILFYQVKFWKGQPKSVHHSELKWVHHSELKNTQLPEANFNVLDNILELFKAPQGNDN